MQFITTTFSNQTQTVEGKTFQILTVEQVRTLVCDQCNFSLTGTKDETENGGWLLLEDLTLCDECSY